LFETGSPLGSSDFPASASPIGGTTGITSKWDCRHVLYVKFYNSLPRKGITFVLLVEFFLEIIMWSS
jgi:hypothetical protein